jgi:hypothetical protein
MQTEMEMNGGSWLGVIGMMTKKTEIEKRDRGRRH